MTGVGAGPTRIEAVAKVTGAARYAGEIALEGRAYGHVVQSRIARGRIRGIDPEPVLAMPGVLAVLTHENAPRLHEGAGDGELMLLQGETVSYRGQAVALVVAETLEQARAGADALRVDYAEDEHDVLLATDHPRLYAPEKVNPDFPTDTETGDVDAALR